MGKDAPKPIKSKRSHWSIESLRGSSLAYSRGWITGKLMKSSGFGFFMDYDGRPRRCDYRRLALELPRIRDVRQHGLIVSIVIAVI